MAPQGLQGGRGPLQAAQERHLPWPYAGALAVNLDLAGLDGIEQATEEDRRLRYLGPGHAAPVLRRRS